ncbi:hypothetical protein AB0C34_14220 [Nocardia sp. NPDC049220]|uniref:hypothetical protein n=1 Tax=Nocardia sp. NPDC049220 TaxID=3155273 RepID=UPI003400F37F
MHTTFGLNDPVAELGTNRVESWFFRANCPTTPRAIWIKATFLTSISGRNLAQAWVSVFDGDTAAAAWRTIDYGDATVISAGGNQQITIGDTVFAVTGEGGMLRGHLNRDGQDVRWDIAFDRVEDGLAEPFVLIGTAAKVRRSRFPANKVVSPFPVVHCSGTVTIGSEVWVVDGWSGMQGHNWGPAHSRQYVWGQAVFSERSGQQPVAYVEAASARVAIGNRMSPYFSVMTVRHGAEIYRFDRLFDLHRQHVDVAFPSWRLRMRGAAATAMLSMTAHREQFVILPYQNPAAPTRYCLNSKLARVELRIEPHTGNDFVLRSEHGGALEFLVDDPRSLLPTATIPFD